jgi:hypothetical protein
LDHDGGALFDRFAKLLGASAGVAKIERAIPALRSDVGWFRSYSKAARTLVNGEVDVAVLPGPVAGDPDIAPPVVF